MKLIIQIPCKNEQDNLPTVLAELPREIPGIDVIEYMVIDDGSTDHTAQIARDLGVHHVISFTQNKGLGYAFSTGMDYALSQGADILVNTDADNQYPSRYISDLVQPIVSGQANIVIGDRQPTKIQHFGWLKRQLQGLGNWIVSKAAGSRMPDSVSGFRAYDRHAMYELNVTQKFSYVIDTIIQAHRKSLKIDRVVITTNPPTRPSRLFDNIWQHIQKSTVNILRVYLIYQPLKALFWVSIPFLIVGIWGIGRFMVAYLSGEGTGKIQSLIIAGIVMNIGIVMIALGIIGDLISKNRFLAERQLTMLKEIKYGPQDIS